MLARFISTTPIISLVRRLDSKANYLVPVLISACNLRTKLSDVSHVIIRCHSFTNINSTINEKLGSCMFPALIKSIVVEKKRVSPCHLRRHFFIHSCTCWIRDKVIYTCNVRRSWRSKWCWLNEAFGFTGEMGSVDGFNFIVCHFLHVFTSMPIIQWNFKLFTSNSLCHGRCRS